MNPAKKRSVIRRSASILASAGYCCVLGPQPFDLIGVSSVGLVLVFVGDRWPLPTERDAIEQFVCPPNARKIAHRWPRRSHLPAVREM